ncbi:MAG: hypothetical protein HYR60_31495 [Acidobacteria bacterium]|nr:hypothetical protein [Acidobacteriota bacterium]
MGRISGTEESRHGWEQRRTSRLDRALRLQPPAFTPARTAKTQDQPFARLMNAAVELNPPPAAATPAQPAVSQPGAFLRDAAVTARIDPNPSTPGSGIDLKAWATKSAPAPAPDASRPVQLIGNNQWTREMLTGDLSPDLLQQMRDPAGFLNARRAILQRPTDAVQVNLYDSSRTPLNPVEMSTPEQAEAMRVRLAALGLSGDVKPVVSRFQVDYRTDDRRHFTIGRLNVGRLAERYAMYPKELADSMTKQELKDLGLVS